MLPYRIISGTSYTDQGQMSELVSRRDDNMERHILLQKEYSEMIKQDKFIEAFKIGSYLKSLEKENKILDGQINMLAGLSH